MQMPSRLSILFNGAALLIVGASAAAVLRSAFLPEGIAACSARYHHGTQLSLERAPGDLLTPADLQARFGGTDWGLLENTSIVGRKDSPTGRALEVRLAKAAAPTSAPNDQKSGVGFMWQPRLVGAVPAACLSYSVFLPENFEFGKGGRLPGLVGTSDANGAVTFSTRYVWRANGGLEIYGHLPRLTEGRWLSNERGDFFFPRGRWVALEQEVILNTPGQSDGILRAWVDGALKFEKSGLMFRENSDARISGALVEAAPNGGVADASPSVAPKLWLSPFELRWQ